MRRPRRELLYIATTRPQHEWRHDYNWSSALAAFKNPLRRPSVRRRKLTP